MRIFKLVILISLFTSPLWAKEKTQPLRLDQILSLKEPVKEYAKTYTSFVYAGQVEVVTEQQTEEGEPALKEREATWVLRWDEQGNFHLSKTSLIKNSSLDLIYLNRQFYLRQNHETDYQPSPPQNEFFAWVNLLFRDPFGTFAKIGYGQTSEFSLEGQVSCSHTEDSKLCVDPEQKLPLQGRYVDRSQPSRSVQLTFSLEPHPREKVQVTLPAPAENPTPPTK